MCAINLGKGNVKRARNVFSICMIATLVISAILVAAILLFTKWIELNQSDDPTVNMGIKLVVDMAKDVTYVSTLDLNIITLRI